MKYRVSNFSSGMVSDFDPIELPNNVFSSMENCDPRNRSGNPIDGQADIFSDLPSGVTPHYAEKFKLSIVYQKEIWLLHAKDGSGNDKLYVKPHISTVDGSFVDSWEDLTESEEGLTVTSVTGNTACVINGLSQSTANYYKGWILNNSTASGSTIIDSSTTGKQLNFFAHSISGQAASDTVSIYRNPFKDVLGSVFKVGDYGISFLKNKDDSIQIYCPNTESQATALSDMKLFAYKERVNPYGTSSYTEPAKFYLCEKNIDPFDDLDAAEVTLTNEAVGANEVAIEDPDPVSGFIVAVTAVYDGYQETPVRTYGVGERIFRNYIDWVTSKVIDVSVKINLIYDTTTSRDVPFTPFFESELGVPTVSATPFVYPRRVTSIRIYGAKADQYIGGEVKPTRRSKFRLLKEAVVSNSSHWSYSGTFAEATVNFDIDKNLWDASPEVDLSEELGHDALQTFSNARFGVVSNNTVFVAGVRFYDQPDVDNSSIYRTPVKASGDNMPDVVPFIGSSIALADYNMSEILGGVASESDAVFFTDKGIISIDSVSFGVKSKFDENTLVNRHAAVQANGLMYFAAKNDLMVYYPRFNTVKSIAAGKIREEWRKIDKDSNLVAVGYDNKLDIVIFSAGSEKFLFNVPSNPADSLTADTDAFGAWHKYIIPHNYVRYKTLPDGQLMGVTADNKMHGLFDPSSTQSMTMKITTNDTDGPVNLHYVLVKAKNKGKIDVNVYDSAISASSPIDSLPLYFDSIGSTDIAKFDVMVDNLKIEFVSSDGCQIIFYDVYYTEQTEN